MFEIVLILEKTTSTSDNTHVFGFANTMVSEMGGRSELGRYSRMGIYVHNPDLHVISDIGQDLTLTSLKTRIRDFEDTSTACDASCTQYGLNNALLDVRDRLRNRIENQMFGRLMQRRMQAIIVFKHSALDSDTLEQSRDVLQWFMDQDIHVFIAGMII